MKKKISWVASATLMFSFAVFGGTNLVFTAFMHGWG